MNVEVFLSHGSLLGWQRECDFIIHTHDVDLGVPYDQISTRTDELIGRMKNAGNVFTQTQIYMQSSSILGLMVQLTRDMR